MMRTVLLIDDDKQIRRMVRDYLELEKFTCLIAENGREGIELAKKYLPDLIISDIMMPEVNGYELKKALSNEPATALIPFIYITSKTEREDIRKGMQLGADDYLFKPFKLTELMDAIGVQLEKRKRLLDEYAINESVKNSAPLEYNEYFMIKDKGNLRFVKVNEIITVIADQKYTRVVLASKDKIIASRTMKEWEEILPKANFVRIHRSYIINLAFIEKIEKWFDRSYKVKLKIFEEPLYISKRYYSTLKELF